MESILNNQLIADRILIHLALRQKLRLRRVNKATKAAIESWTRRHLRTLKLDGSFSLKDTIKLIEMSSEQPTSIVLDIRVNNGRMFTRLWRALKGRFMAARELTFGARSLTEISKWRQSIPFGQLQCESIVLMDTNKHDEVIALLVEDLQSMPRLQSIRFCGPSIPHDAFVNSSLGKRLLNASSLLRAKVKLIGIFAESTDQVEVLQRNFPNLRAMSISLKPHNHQGALLAFSFHTIEFRIPVERIGAINLSQIEALQLKIMFGDIKSFLPAFGQKCPQLKELCIIDHGDTDKTCKIIFHQKVSWIMPLILENFPHLLKLNYHPGWWLGGPDRYLLNGKSFPAHPITSIEIAGWLNITDLKRLLLACPSLHKVTVRDISFKSRYEITFTSRDRIVGVLNGDDEHNFLDLLYNDLNDGSRSFEFGSNIQQGPQEEEVGGRIKHFCVTNLTAFQNLDKFSSFIDKFLLSVTHLKIEFDCLEDDDESEFSDLLAPALELILEKCLHLKNLTVYNHFETELEVSVPAQCKLTTFGVDKLIIPSKRELTWSHF